MNPTPTFDFAEAPVLNFTKPKTKWDHEYAAFLRLLPELLKTHYEQYVAIHEGRVVGAGLDKLAVATEAYQKFGKQEILVRLVSDKPPRIVRILSPRVVHKGGS